MTTARSRRRPRAPPPARATVPITLVAKVSTGARIGRAHERLRRQVEDDFRPRALHRASRRAAAIADVGTDVLAAASCRSHGHAQRARLGRRIEREAVTSAPSRAARARASALEAGVAGDQDPATPPERLGSRHHSLPRGAACRPQLLRACVLSRSVSIGCQKPSCSNAIS